MCFAGWLRIKNILLFLFFIFIRSLFAQNPIPAIIPYDKDFVKLKEGDFYTGNQLYVQNEFLKQTKITIDANTFGGNKVAFYNKNNTLYGNTRNRFIPCLYKVDHLNFFQGIYESNGAGRRSAFITYYYSKDLYKVKKLKIYNLYKDLRDYEQPNKLIKKAGRDLVICISSFVAAEASAMIPLLLSKDPPGFYYALPLGLAVNGIVFLVKRKREAQHALIALDKHLPKYMPKYFTHRQKKDLKKQEVLDNTLINGN